LHGFYDGLSAGLARQIVYGTARLGLYTTFEDALIARSKQQDSTYGFGQRALASLSAGAIASFIGNPTEVALIRMQSDGLRPLAERAHYRSVIDAFWRIGRNEGIASLWSGCLPTVLRAMCTNLGQLAFFSESKQRLKDHTALSPHAQSLIASGIGGFFAALFSMPADVVKSRLQSQSGKKEYRGIAHCCASIIRNEGARTFYRGFPAYASRLAPHS
jgi:solute carrier family 25 oxoglutarate transporter 11